MYMFKQQGQLSCGSIPFLSLVNREGNIIITVIFSFAMQQLITVI